MICFSMYYLMEHFETRTMTYGSRSFKITENQLQGKIIYFKRAIEYFILCTDDLLIFHCPASSNIRSGNLEHRCSCFKALQEIYHGTWNFDRINRWFLFIGRIKAASIQSNFDNQKRDKRTRSMSLFRD